MPFTLSHPAAVLPLRRYGVFSALIFGSMAPDFLYFVPGHTFAYYGHTRRGLFFFCLPAGWVALWLFHVILKRPLAELFPESIAAKLRTAVRPFGFGVWPLGPERVMLISGSILAGALSHIVWDAATHANGIIAQEIPFLMVPVINIADWTILRVQLVQELSTVLGVAALAWAFRSWLQHAPTAEEHSELSLSPAAKLWIPALMLTLALAYSVPLGLVPLHYRLRSFLNWEYFLRITVIIGMRTYFILLLVFCGVWHLLAARRAPVQPPG